MVERATMASISLSWNVARSRFNVETTLDCEVPPRLNIVIPTMILPDADDKAVLLAGGSHSTCYTGSVEPQSFRRKHDVV